MWVEGVATKFYQLAVLDYGVPGSVDMGLGNLWQVSVISEWAIDP